MAAIVVEGLSRESMASVCPSFRPSKRPAERSKVQPGLPSSQCWAICLAEFKQVGCVSTTDSLALSLSLWGAEFGAFVNIARAIAPTGWPYWIFSDLFQFKYVQQPDLSTDERHGEND